MAIIPRDPLKLARSRNDADFERYLELMGSFVEPPIWSGILTPDFIPPDGSTLADGQTPRFVRVSREVSDTRRLMTRDGVNTELVDFWGFNNKDFSNYHYPSEPIRLVEGQIFHGLLHNTSHGPGHSIHWHGIEPTTHNDGVGHFSMEVGSGGYEYQWQATAAGTHFYHCHRNTVLHFKMGMYGMVIIDPPPPAGSDHATLQPLGVNGNVTTIGYGYPMGGPGYARRGDEVVPYDVEAIWVLDEVDPMWNLHLGHGHLMADPRETGILDVQGNDLGARFRATTRDDPMGLHNYNPQYFCISGIPHPWTLLDAFPPQLTDAALGGDPNLAFLPPVPATLQVGQTLLVRMLCASYNLSRVIIQGLDVEVIAMDGRALGCHPYTKYSAPFKLAAGVPIELTTARRLDLLIRPTSAGDYRVQVEFLHRINHQVLGIAETLIHVVAQEG